MTTPHKKTPKQLNNNSKEAGSRMLMTKKRLKARANSKRAKQARKEQR